jgi:membrane-bound inhibitor of C-type lysozyme
MGVMNAKVACHRLLAAAAAAAALAATPASAGALQVPQIQASPPVSRIYRCAGGGSLTVTYWNGRNGQSFALVPVGGTPLLFVDTLAASGVKYEAGRYTWWTKGNQGDLYDMTAGPNAPPIMAGCSSLVTK